jgi:plasmid maintenance system antidote protein VapI
MRFRDAVAAEFERRRKQNPRYSLRAFARGMCVHHSTLSRLLAGTQPVHSHTIGTLGARMGLSARQIQSFAAHEDIAAVIRRIERSTFRPDSRWLATRCGISVDRINIALQRLLRCGRLRMISADEWLVVDNMESKHG